MKGITPQTYIKTADGIDLYCRVPYNDNWKGIEARSNGCGAQGWKIDIVPDSVLGCNIQESCRIHDVDYGTLRKTIENKESADRTFLNNMLRLVNARTTNWFAKKLLLMPRRKAVYGYYLAVKQFAGPAFWDRSN